MVNGLQQITIDYTPMEEEVKMNALRCVTNVLRDAEVTKLKEENEEMKRNMNDLKKMKEKQRCAEEMRGIFRSVYAKCLVGAALEERVEERMMDEDVDFCEVCFQKLPGVVWYRNSHSYKPPGSSGLYSACPFCVRAHAITGELL